MRQELQIHILRMLGTGMLAGLSVTLGCQGDTTVPADTGGAGGAEDQGGAGDQGGVGGQGGAGDAPATCESRRGDHNDACPADAPCAITLDVEVTCTDATFAAGGVRAVPAAGATYLVTSSDDPTRLFELDDDGATQRDFDVQSNTLSVALSPDGRAYAAVNETTGSGDGYPGGIVFLPLVGSAAERQRVFDRDDNYVPVLDVAVDSRGEPHIWINTDVRDNSLAHATRTSSGAWDVAPASRPSGSDYARFALAPDDAPLAFGLVEALPGVRQLTVLDGTTERSLGAPDSASSLLDYEPVRPPQPAGQATFPRFAAVVQHTDGLRLASASEDGGFDEVAIPGTETPTSRCQDGVEIPPPGSTSCPAECHMVASGLAWSAFAAARTSDGDAWIALLISHIDETLTYELQDTGLDRVCVGHTVADESRGELRLVRVPAAGGAPEVAVTLPLPAIAGGSYFNDLHEQHPLVDVSAFGTELTVAMRTQASREGPFTARVVRVDTSLLAPAAPGG
ncbi:hypothetical protein [Sorangium sp. So ce363]|uniref:hypothetical protein n=1 Tax=Sorangium sp. So ce363 TaxID=3133304 RepID=UPI003F5E50E3